MGKFKGFCIVFGLSCRELLEAKDTFPLSLSYQKANIQRQVLTVAYQLSCGLLHFLSTIPIKMGYFCLTFLVKIGYNIYMFGSIMSFVLRIWLIAVFWGFIWRFVEPRTQPMRILRAALLLLGLLGILTALRITGG